MLLCGARKYEERILLADTGRCTWPLRLASRLRFFMRRTGSAVAASAAAAAAAALSEALMPMLLPSPESIPQSMTSRHGMALPERILESCIAGERAG